MKPKKRPVLVSMSRVVGDSVRCRNHGHRKLIPAIGFKPRVGPTKKPYRPVARRADPLTDPTGLLVDARVQRI